MTYRIYQDAKGQWRWRLVAANRQIIADSAEGYQTKADCLNGIELVKQSANAPVVSDLGGAGVTKSPGRHGSGDEGDDTPAGGHGTGDPP